MKSKLLIAPEGIEIFKAHRRLTEHPFLLIAPEGIEIRMHESTL